MYKRNIIKEKTEAELAAQAQGLSELCSILDSFEIEYYLSGGTLLGIIREGDFIKWDWDVEVAVKSEEIISRYDELLIVFKQKDFNLHSKNTRNSNFKLNLLKYDTRYEILGYYYEDGFRKRMRSKMPANFFTPGCIKTLRGVSYQVLNPPIDYLDYNYGDWQTPLKTKNRADYTTSSSRNRPDLLERIKNIFRIG